MPFSMAMQQRVPGILSSERFQKYLVQANQDIEKALSLYQWNLEISSALMVPLGLLEVSLRNGILGAIEAVHGPNWYSSQNFLRSLPNPPTGYSPNRDLRRVVQALTRVNHLTTGCVVAELKFAFWQYMLTRRHDGRFWRSNFFSVFPNADQTQTFNIHRGIAYNDIDAIRRLRNRIAHHEPIFAYHPDIEFEKMRKLIGWRCMDTLSWLDKIEGVSRLLISKPII